MTLFGMYVRSVVGEAGRCTQGPQQDQGAEARPQIRLGKLFTHSSVTRCNGLPRISFW